MRSSTLATGTRPRLPWRGLATLAAMTAWSTAWKTTASVAGAGLLLSTTYAAVGVGISPDAFARLIPTTSFGWVAVVAIWWGVVGAALGGTTCLIGTLTWCWREGGSCENTIARAERHLSFATGTAMAALVAGAAALPRPDMLLLYAGMVAVPSLCAGMFIPEEAAHWLRWAQGTSPRAAACNGATDGTTPPMVG